MVPKVDHEDHLEYIGQEISRVMQSNPDLLHQRPEPLSIVASIESAQALWRIGDIAQWKSKRGRLSALLVRPKRLLVVVRENSRSLQFAAEDCMWGHVIHAHRMAGLNPSS